MFSFKTSQSIQLSKISTLNYHKSKSTKVEFFKIVLYYLLLFESRKYISPVVAIVIIVIVHFSIYQFGNFLRFGFRHERIVGNVTRPFHVYQKQKQIGRQIIRNIENILHCITIDDIGTLYIWTKKEWNMFHGVIDPSIHTPQRWLQLELQLFTTSSLSMMIDVHCVYVCLNMFLIISEKKISYIEKCTNVNWGPPSLFAL